MRDPMLPRTWTVEAVRREGGNTVTLDFVPGDDGRVFEWRPGQFTMLYVLGVGEVPISISGDPADTGRIVHTIRGVGAVSRALTELRPGDAVGMRGPFGRPWPLETAVGQDILIVAGGLGLAPVRPILDHVLANRLDYGHVALLYGNRTNVDLLYYDALQAWRTHLDLEVYVTVDRADPSWRGHVGLVTQLLPKASFDPVDTTAFVCGPEIMMRFVARHLEDMAVDPGQIHLSLERNMQCAVGTCGHCQFGSDFVCKDGPVFSAAALAGRLGRKEL
jgi:NAD(P)H-flavin reductase